RRRHLAGALPAADGDRGRCAGRAAERELMAATGAAVRRRKRHGKQKHEIGDTLLGRWFRVYIPVLVFIFITLFPFYWMAITSIKSDSELLDHTRSPLFVIQPTLQHYQNLFTKTN